MNKHLISLDGAWRLRFTLDDTAYETTAAVPGNVEPALQALGLAGDIFPADDQFAMAKFETVDDWTYSTTFDAPPLADGYTRALVFEGIDTLAEIYLNGEKLGDTCDMHMTYRFAAPLREKANELTVVIRSVDLWARSHPHDNFAQPHGGRGYYDSQAYVRKARHQWGWDNAPRLITAGIVRSVYIEDLPPKRFDEVYIYTTNVSDTTADMGYSFVYQTPAKIIAGHHEIRLSLLDGENIVHTVTHPVYFTQGFIRFGVSREKIKLWWPDGFGAPQLYTARVEMLEDGEVAATYEETIGIRTLRTIHTDDVTADGKGDFTFVVNNEKVFIRGANWKPLDPLASEADKKTKSLEAMGALTALHCNMVRIWGGGIYEDKAFFDYCDRHGIMVWQDFMLACEVPPTDECFVRTLAAEAKQIVKKQRNHPSMAIWCGDNENDQSVGWSHLGNNARPSHSVSTRRILRDAVIHFDPWRDYVDSSPVYSDEFYAKTVPGLYPTEMHLYPYTPTFAKSLRECRARFIGETGPITINSIAAADELYEREYPRMKRLWDSPQIASTGAHQDDGYFVGWRIRGKDCCMQAYGRDFTVDEWKEYALAVNLICAEVFKDVLEYSRVVRWEKTGIIWWSLCDMFPMAFNYSVMDYKLRPKLAYHFIEKSQQPFALMAVRTEVGGELALYAANDTLEAKKVSYTVTAYNEACEAAAIASGIITQAKNSASLIQRMAEPDAPELWIIRWQDGGKEYQNHVFTGKVSWDVMRKWARILVRETGMRGVNEIE